MSHHPLPRPAMRVGLGAMALLLPAVAGYGISPGLAQAAPAPSASDQRFEDVDAYLQNRMAATRTPGMAYAIVGPDSIEHVAAWGHDRDGQPVTEGTSFLWGSVAKPVTATAVMTLVEDGAVDLDESVRSYLPSFTLADDAAAGEITVRHLLQQTSGIPEGTGITDRFDEVPDPYAAAVADLADVEPLTAPGAEHEYTSANYLVLGAVVEAVTGLPFDQYLREHVLMPFRMGNAVTTPTEAAEAVAGGHGYAFGRVVGVPARYDRTGPSYGYLGGTVEDLAHFAMAHLNGGLFGSTRVLEEDSVELMRTGTARISDTTRYGLGWYDEDRNADLGTRTIRHGGAVHGYHAMMVLLPELDRGVVVLQNVYGIFQDSELTSAGFGAARILAGGEPHTPPSDPTYALILTGLAVVLALLVAAIGWSFRGLRRLGTGTVRRPILIGTICWTIGGLALAYVAGVLAPGMVGARLPLIRLWAPDVGWLLVGIIAASLLLAATRIVTGVIRLCRLERGSARTARRVDSCARVA